MSDQQRLGPLRSLSDLLGNSVPALGDIAKPATTPQSSLLEILASLGSPPPPPVIRDRWFKDLTIYVDGYAFERCRFDACTLVVGEATFTFKQCFIAPTCRLLFTGRSLKLARLMLHLMKLQERIEVLEGEEGVFAAMGTDGTFTVE